MTESLSHKSRPRLAEHARSWQFLNITEPSQSRHEAFQDRVKKNATQRYRQYERQKRVEAFAEAKRKAGTAIVISSSVEDTLPIPPEGSASKQKKLHELQSNEENRVSELVQHPRTLLGAGMIDPFETCPTGGNRAYYHLVNHCKYHLCNLITNQVTQRPYRFPNPVFLS